MISQKKGCVLYIAKPFNGVCYLKAEFYTEDMIVDAAARLHWGEALLAGHYPNFPIPTP